MANLGFHAVYRIANAEADVACERAFLPEEPGAEPRTVESGRPLRDLDVVAFSLSFEDDYVNVLDVLRRSGIPLRSADRDARHPLVVAGGIAVQINPEPLAPFFDLFLVGEGEELLPSFFRAMRRPEARGPRPEALRALSQVPGAYVPSLYDVAYADTREAGGRWVTRLEPREGVP
jgi:radical SAM superfamily enzyme YgiQ (UPF0313 family)